LLFGGLLGAAGLAAHLGKGALTLAAPDPPALTELIPERVGSWRYAGFDGIILPSEAPKSDDYDQELQRVYLSDEAPPMMLVIAYCGRPQQGLLQIHDPRICYPGAGFSLQQDQTISLNAGGAIEVEAQAFTAVRPGRTEQVIYWMRVGDSIKSPADDQHLAILRSVVRGSVPDGLLFRMSALGEGAAPMREIRRFGGELLKAVSQPVRELLIGRTLASIASGTGAAPAR
jgi:EpsI family protein